MSMDRSKQPLRRRVACRVPAFFIAGVAPMLPCAAQCDAQCAIDKLVAPVSDPGILFGNAIAVENDVLFCGAPLQSVDGVVHVYSRALGAWNFVQTIAPSPTAGGTQFGSSSMDIDGDLAAIAAPYDDTSGVDCGAVYVFRFNGFEWVQEAKLIAPPPGDGLFLGEEVVIDDPFIYVGAPGICYIPDCGPAIPGTVFVFERTGPTWAQHTISTIDAPDSEPGDRFGESLGLHGDVLAVGAVSDDGVAPNTGSVCVFRRTAPRQWAFEARLTASDAKAVDALGYKTVVGPDLIVSSAIRGEVSASGSAYAFRWSGGRWFEEHKFVEPGGGATLDHFGISLALAGDDLVVGASNDDAMGPDAGAAWLFSYNGRAWGEPTLLTPADVGNQDLFGFAAAIDGAHAYVSSVFDDDVGGPLHGAVYDILLGGRDADGDGQIDACEVASIVSQWLCGSASFQDSGCWLPAAPTGTQSVSFAPGASIDVTFDASDSIGRLDVFAGAVTLDLAGHVLTCTTNGDAIGVGGSPSPTLVVAGGTLRALTGRMQIGDGRGARGTAMICGELGRLEAFDLDVIDGSLELCSGNVAAITGSGANIFAGGELVGAGMVVGNVTNLGHVAPGGAEFGALGIEKPTQGFGGNYSQLQVEVGGSVIATGALSIEIGGPAPGIEHDVLVVAEEAFLSGLLNVSFPEPGYDPPAGSSHTILEAGDGVIGIFDVALLPGLADGKFLTVNYPTGIGVGGEVTVDVVSLDPNDLFQFLESGPAEVEQGVPIAVTTCNIDGEPGLDLALVLANADDPRSKPGSLVVLLNADIQDGVLMFGASYQFNLGIDPRAIVAANLAAEGGVGLDELIVAEFGEDRIRVLGDLEIGQTPMFATSYTVPVGDGPAAVTAADFTGDGKIDVATVNMLSQDVSVLLNLLEPSMPLMPTSPLPLDEEGCSIAPNQTIPPDDQEVFGLVVGSRTGSRVHVFPSVGGLRPFEQSLAPISVGPEPLDLIVADLNADGFDDIVTSNLGDGTVSVIVASGAATYAPAVHLQVGTLPGDNGALSTADFDLDGDPDIAVVALVDGERVVKVLRNDSTPGGTVLLADIQDVSGGGGTLLVLSDDVDGDTDIDLITIDEPAEFGDRIGPLAALVSSPPNSLISCPALPGDVNDDGFVNGADLGVLLAGWGSPGGCADLNGSGVVDGADLGILLSGWTG